MGRPKKGQTFADLFGSFSAVATRGKNGDYETPPALVKIIDDGRAHPCNICGKYPRVHVVFFKDAASYPNRYYIDCDNCCNCNGEWYATENEAIDQWNIDNPLVNVPVNNIEVTKKKFIREIMEDFRIDS